MEIIAKVVNIMMKKIIDSLCKYVTNIIYHEPSKKLILYHEDIDFNDFNDYDVIFEMELTDKQLKCLQDVCGDIDNLSRYKSISTVISYLLKI